MIRNKQYNHRLMTLPRSEWFYEQKLMNQSQQFPFLFPYTLQTTSLFKSIDEKRNPTISPRKPFQSSTMIFLIFL